MLFKSLNHIFTLNAKFLYDKYDRKDETDYEAPQAKKLPIERYQL